MKDTAKTKKQLIKELEKLQQQITSLKKSKTKGDLKKDLFQLAQLALNNSSDAIAWIRKDAHILYVNDTVCEVLGYSREEMLTKTVHDIDPGYTPAVWKNYWKELRRNRSLTFETIAQKKDGTIIPMEVTANYVKLGNDEYNFSFSKDITQRKETERKLKDYRDHLEDLVKNRTLELSLANQKLNQEITERKKAEKEIQKTKESLENIFMTSVDGIMIADSEGKISAVNKAAEKIFDCSSDQLIGKHTSELEYHEVEFQISGIELMERLMSEGTISGVERTVKKPDGTTVVVEMNIALLKDDEGSMKGSVASIRDITDRKKAEEALLKSEEKYRGLVNNIGIGVSLISPNMEILALNNQMQQWFPKANVSKKPICYKTFNNPPREKVCCYCPTFQTLQDGQIHESITDTPQGDKNIHYKIISSPLKDKEGKITSAIEMVEDITEQQAAQQKLQESEEKYHNLIEYANDAIITTDPKGTILGFNRKAEQMFGYSREEILGKSNELLVAEQSRGKQKEEEKKLEEIGVGYDSGERILEWTCVRKDGEEFPVEFTFYAIEIGGEVIANSIVRDVSKRKEEEKILINYQKKLKALTKKLISSEQKDRQHFADFLHDEIGQQLFATRLQLEQLKGSLSSAENIHTIDTVLNNLSQIMNQTRSLTSELSSPILKQLGLENALEWLAEETYKKYDIMVTVEDDKQEKPLDDNIKLLLYQAVSELLANVAKHARTKSAEVSIRKDDSNVRVCVKDNGIGFLQLNEDFSHVKNGGIGLFRIKERLEPLGGQLEIKSQPKRGTQVILLAPLKNTT
jgi:PAS domain S-box-containing protein